MIWLPLFGLCYVAMTLYWARIAARENEDFETYFSAGHSIPGWISALVVAGASVSGWAVLVGAAEIGQQGFSFPAILQAGIAIALPGVFFFKRIWLLGQRLRLSSLSELLRAYWESEFLVAFSTIVAVIFAIAFAGVQLSALARLMVLMTGGAMGTPVAATILAFVLFGYVGIGGMRAVGYMGAMQAVFAAAAILGLAAFVVIELSGFASVNAGLAKLAADPVSAGKFVVSGVIQFTAGAGREAAAGHEGTAVASLSLAFALMGLQASPMAIKVILSTRDPKGIAAGQTWVMAGAFGALICVCVTCLGVAALIDPSKTLPGLLTNLSPWFSAWLLMGLLAGVQLMAGLALISAGEALVRNIYKPWFHSALSRRDTVTMTRIVIAALILVSVLMQELTPVTLSMLAALTLPLAFQLWTPLLGMTWLRWFTAPAVVCGVGFGIAGVLLTEPFGITILSAFGIDLPWGRSPWTINSAAWGMSANFAVTLLISVFTQRREFGEAGLEARRFLYEFLARSPKVGALRSTAWSVSLAWMFLAVGPGLVLGNYAFNQANGSSVFGVPSQWGWGLLSWIAGLGVVWFLSYKMGMARAHSGNIPAYEPARRLRRDQSAVEQQRLRILFVTSAVSFGLIIFLVFSFGRV